MTLASPASPALQFLEDRWNPAVAAALDEPERLRYRSNLLGSDLRITNFAGGNTSSKIAEIDPLTGKFVEVLWVKGSGGDLGSIRRGGFATLYQEKFLSLERCYKGVETEDEMVAMYPLCTFRNNPVAASIDTPLHGFLPFPHVDHLHPDWAIALAASANGKSKMEEFNRQFGHSLVWLPWLRPGFELGLTMKRAVEENPGCDGIVLGGHGLFTWGLTQRECYWNTLTVIDRLGQFIHNHGQSKGPARFGGQAIEPRADRTELAVQIAPCLRGRISTQQRWIDSFTGAPDVLQFVNSADARAMAFLGTSCPDHFIRTKIRPLFIDWKSGESLDELKRLIDASLAEYRKQYRAYYHSFATADSPALRDPNPTVVLIAGLGMFSFGKTKTEARIVGEFYTNAIHVMEGATLLADGAAADGAVPQCGKGNEPAQFKVFNNYVALPAIEAFRIEYWAMEEAKIRRQPPEKEFSRRIALVVGGASEIGREVVRLAAARGAHVMVADREQKAAVLVSEEHKSTASAEFVASTTIDTRNRASVVEALRATVAAFGGLDILIDAEPPFPASPSSAMPAALEGQGAANRLLVDETAKLFAEQGLGGSIVLTNTAQALIDGLAADHGPRVRINGIGPATGGHATIFSRDRARASLAKYNVCFEESMSDGELRGLLTSYYAKQTLSQESTNPVECAEAILFLASPRARGIAGCLIPVDGGLNEAFSR